MTVRKRAHCQEFCSFHNGGRRSYQFQCLVPGPLLFLYLELIRRKLDFPQCPAGWAFKLQVTTRKAVLTLEALLCPQASHSKEHFQFFAVDFYIEYSHDYRHCSIIVGVPIHRYQFALLRFAINRSKRRVSYLPVYELHTAFHLFSSPGLEILQ